MERLSPDAKESTYKAMLPLKIGGCSPGSHSEPIVINMLMSKLNVSLLKESLPADSVDPFAYSLVFISSRRVSFNDFFNGLDG